MSQHRKNHFPIVLVGGLLVWGREERFGFKYWGGREDLQEVLNREGFHFLTAAPGPFSSNWDRACEIFAIIKGGRVDYGKAHAMRHGHARYGEDYPGLYRGWGEKAKVHLLGHSMGGQTVRMLAHLLSEGDEEERRVTPGGELSPLFAGENPWAASLCTISTPHLGTTLAWKRDGYVDAVHKSFALAAHFDLKGWRRVFNLKLSQWGLERGDSESGMDFFRRVSGCPLWKGTRDLAAFELSPEGAARLNQRLSTPEWLPCFSWSLSKTSPDRDGNHVPQSGMLPLWRRNARYMGQTLQAKGFAPVDESWFQSDGVVNTCSMAGPAGSSIILAGQGGPPDPQRHYAPGVWHHMGIKEGWDHTEILGIGYQHKNEWLDFYRQWACLAARLEDGRL